MKRQEEYVGGNIYYTVPFTVYSLLMDFGR